MLKIPNVNKQNWKKILREMDLASFPSLTPALASIRNKVIEKEELTFPEKFAAPNLLLKYFDEYSEEVNSYYMSSIDWSKFDKKPPKNEEQKEGVEFLLKNNKCILADTMGKGKTITAVYASLLLEETAKILIVTTKSLKYSFVKEIEVFTDKFHVVDKEFVESKFVVLHYEQLKKYYNEVIKFNPNIIIVDECHNVKNLKTVRGKYLQEILKKNYPNKLWLLTGTPIANRPSEFYSLLKLIKHEEAKSWEKYMVTYCNAFKNYFGYWDTSGASNLDLLHQRTRDIVLRRVNKEGELPPFERTPVYLQMSDKLRKEYNGVLKKYEKIKTEEFLEEFGELKDLGFKTKTNELVKIVLWRQFCAIAKIKDEYFKDIIKEKLAEDPTNKIIIFTNYTSVVDTIKEQYGQNCLTLDGRVTESKKRQDIVDEFNTNPEIRILGANIQVGGTGYNIQSANCIIVNDMDLIPNSMLQAEGRAWRYGQTKAVEALYPIYDDSIEEMLFKLINEKMEVISNVVDGAKENFFQSVVDSNTGNSKKDLLEEIFKQFDFN